MRPNWELFRTLVRYYIRCLQAENGCTSACRQSAVREDYIYLREQGLWFPKPGTVWNHVIAAREKETICSLWREGNRELLLGYPVHAFPCRKGTLYDMELLPVFCFPLRFSTGPAGIRIQAEQEVPFVNDAWLNKVFPATVRGSGPARHRFLVNCGLASTLEREGEAIPGLHELAAILGNVFGQAVREPLNPEALSAEPIPAGEGLPGGIFNRAVLVAGHKVTTYTRRLIDELKEILAASDAVLDATALRTLFTEKEKADAQAKGAGSPVSAAEVCEFLPLNADQRKVVASLVCSELTVIQGPPGTGKSQVAATATVNARLRDSTVLIASQNHKAIDAVMDKLRTEEHVMLVQRANSRDSRDPNSCCRLSDAIATSLASSLDTRRQTSFVEQRTTLLAALARRRSACETAERLEEMRAELARAEDALHRAASAAPWLAADAFPDEQALTDAREALRFLACFNEKPCRLVWQEVRHPLAARSLQRSLARINAHINAHSNAHINGVLQQHAPAACFQLSRSRIYGTAELADLVRALEAMCALFAARAQQQAAAAALAREEALAGDWQAAFAASNATVRQLLPWLVNQDVLRRQGVPQQERARLAQLQQMLKSSRTTLRTGLALRDAARKALFHTPCWAVTSLSTGRFLPLSPGLFDLAIIDEAAQCSIPSALPVLFRARRAAIMGDPNQLAPISRLSQQDHANLLQQARIDPIACARFAYLDNSLYNLAAGAACAQSFLLNLSFRSADAILRYCTMFYSGQLLQAADVGTLKCPAAYKPGISWHNVEGIVERPSAGSCVCLQEAEAVGKLVLDMIQDQSFTGSIGVITPFRAQAQRIQEHLALELGLDVEVRNKYRLHVGTVHAFQGDERDVILLSLCAGPDMSPGTLSFLRAGGNLFNVAASRARALLLVVGNYAWAKLCGIEHIAALARAQEEAAEEGQALPWAPHESLYEQLLYRRLCEKTALVPLIQYPVRCRRLDLALISDTARLDIEVDGAVHLDDDGSRRSDDHWRDEELRELGWETLRIWTWDIEHDIDACVARITALWEKLNS